MNNRSFTLIVALVALTGIIMIALFGTSEVQSTVIPSIAIGSILIIYAYCSSSDKGIAHASGQRNKARNTKDTAANSKSTVSEERLLSVGARENAAA